MRNAGIAKTSAVLRHTHCNGHGKGPGRAARGKEQIPSVDVVSLFELFWTSCFECHHPRHRVYTPPLSTSCTPPIQPRYSSPTSNGAERLFVVFPCENWPHSYQFLDIHSSNPSPCCCIDLILKTVPWQFGWFPVWLPGKLIPETIPSWGVDISGIAKIDIIRS